MNIKENTITSGLSQRVWEEKGRSYLSASFTSKKAKGKADGERPESLA